MHSACIQTCGLLILQTFRPSGCQVQRIISIWSMTMTKEISVRNQSPNMPWIPSQDEWNLLKNQAQSFLKSGLLPSNITTPEAVVVIILKGRELGIPPFQALSHINVISGKPSTSSELMRALIFKNLPGSKLKFVETSSECCIIEAARPGEEYSRFVYSIEDAKRALLTSKKPWKENPQAMLIARCTSLVARTLFPDAISGLSYTPEELGHDVDDEESVVINPNNPNQFTKTYDIEEIKPHVSEYVFPFGKLMGQKLKDIGPIDLAMYCNEIRKKAKEQGKPIQGVVKEALDQAEAYLLMDHEKDTKEEQHHENEELKALDGEFSQYKEVVLEPVTETKEDPPKALGLPNF